MQRSIIAWLLVLLCGAIALAWEEKPAPRPITRAESVMAVFYEDWRLGSSGKPVLILAIWPDGHIVWSVDRFKGGTPYFVGQADRKKVGTHLARFEGDGLFADKSLDRTYFAPDSECMTVFVKSVKQQVEMHSWHELVEESGRGFAHHGGATGLNGQRRLDLLRKEPADYLFYRLVWSETRGKLTALIPNDGNPISGEVITAKGVRSWQERPADVNPDANRAPRKK